MTPEEKREFNTLQKTVESLLRVENVSFIQNIDRRVRGDGIRDDSSTTTVTTIVQSVNEAGAGTYNVAKAPARKVEVTFTDGSTGFIGVYNS